MDKSFTIIRSPSTEWGTFGMMLDGDLAFCLTLELPWRDNEPTISCIPNNMYECRRIVSPRFGNTFEITNVPDRSHILFHRANWVSDLLGCVGLGEEFAILKGKPAIAASGRAFQEFMERTHGVDRFILHVIWALL